MNMIGFQMVNLLLLPIMAVLPVFITYFIIKLAVKNAIKELKDEDVL